MRDEVSSLFREVADLAPSDRTRYFEQHHVPRDLRAEVESLLRFDASDAPVLHLIASTAGDLLDSREAAAKEVRCGPYRLLRLLGRGGTGDVFLAERVDGHVAQQVAIKVLRQRSLPGFPARFLPE